MFTRARRLQLEKAKEQAAAPMHPSTLEDLRFAAGWAKSQFVSGRNACLFDGDPKSFVEAYMPELNRTLGYWGIEYEWVDHGFMYELKLS